MSISISRLDRSHATSYRQLRLQSLQTHPQAFLSTFEHEASKNNDAFAYELAVARSEPIWGYHGIFMNERLVGYVELMNNYLPKKTHQAQLYNLYIDDNLQGQGLGRRLMAHILQLLKKHQIEQVIASYLGKNTVAAHFYQKLGFQEYGRLKKDCKDGDEYDEAVLIYLPL